MTLSWHDYCTKGGETPLKSFTLLWVLVVISLISNIALCWLVATRTPHVTITVTNTVRTAK
jgi:hypothetical protein